jgi:hypothetical protein
MPWPPCNRCGVSQGTHRDLDHDYVGEHVPLNVCPVCGFKINSYSTLGWHYPPEGTNLNHPKIVILQNGRAVCKGTYP